MNDRSRRPKRVKRETHGQELNIYAVPLAL